MIFDEALVVPDMEQPLEGAIQPWRRAGKRMNIYYKAMLRSVAAHFNVSLETPYKDLPEDFRKASDERLRRRTTWNSNSGAPAR